MSIQNREETGKILKQKRNERGLTMKDLASLIGVTDATISRYESGEIGNMKRETIAKLSKILKINPLVILGLESVEIQNNGFNYNYIPDPVAAGIPETIEGMTELPKVSLPDFIMGKYARNRNILIMRVNGESMNKIIPNGSHIAVLRKVEWRDLKDGEIVVFSHGGEFSVKRMYQNETSILFRPMSTDTSFIDYIVPKEKADDVNIIGKVVMYSVCVD